MVMMGMTTLAIVLAVVPFKFIIMSFILYIFTTTSKLRKNTENEQGNRRLKEWWDAIPVIPVELWRSSKIKMAHQDQCAMTTK